MPDLGPKATLPRDLSPATWPPVKWTTIKKLTFGGDIGRMRYNPKTQKFFPPSYNFDPCTGEQLIWKSPNW